MSAAPERWTLQQREALEAIVDEGETLRRMAGLVRGPETVACALAEMAGELNEALRELGYANSLTGEGSDENQTEGPGGETRAQVSCSPTSAQSTTTRPS